MISSGQIAGIQFYCLGDDENEIDGTVSINNKDLFSHGVPVDGGGYDAHMGTTDHSYKCLSCHENKELCPGHPGVIHARYPVQNHMLKDEILQVLKIICFGCGKIILNKPVSGPRSRYLNEYVKVIRNADKNVACVHCAEIHPWVVRDKNKSTIIWAEYYEAHNTTRRVQLFNHRVAQIFDRILPETLEKLGKDMSSHPRKWIINTIRVPSNSIRPDVTRNGGGRSTNDDLTILIKTLVHLNNQLPEIIPDEIPELLEADYTLFDLAYYSFIKGSPSSSKAKYMTNTNRIPTSLSERIPRKAGRIRRNILGSRTWYSARGVITCDPSLRVDEIGIPLHIAKIIQIDEIVTEKNRNRLMIYFTNKTNKYPGCTKVLKKRTGREHHVDSINEHFILEIGDVVMRDVIDGDIVAFNRAPSMTVTSFSSHKVIVFTEGNTIRLNISACVLYNADFDGDAANLMFSKDIIATYQLNVLGGVANKFMEISTGKPLIGLHYDNLAGTTTLTRSEVFIAKYHAMELFDTLDIMQLTNGKGLTQKMYTGRELVSLVLPPINYENTAKYYNEAFAPYIKYREDNIKVKIRQGKLIQGVLDDSSVGQERRNTIFHVIHNDTSLGPKKALDTVFYLQQLGSRFLINKGLTVGIGDVIVPKETKEELAKKSSAMYKESLRITERLRNGQLIAPPDRTVEEFYEENQTEALRNADDFVEPVVKAMNHMSGLQTMVGSCHKGSQKNIIALSGSIGQQENEGSRAKMNFGYERSLPYFPRYDTDPVSRGMVFNSFLDGISPEEYLFTAQVARISRINQALSTSVAGHQSRIAIKNLESLHTNNYRQAVKDDRITQYLYGGNGMDSRRIEHVKCPLIFMDNKTMEESYHAEAKSFGNSYDVKKLQDLLDIEFKQRQNDKKDYIEMFSHVEYVYNNESLSNKVETTANVKRIIDDVCQEFYYAKKQPLDPVKVCETIDKFCHNLGYVFINSIQEKRQTPIPDRYNVPLCPIKILIRSYLSVKQCQLRKISNKMLNLALRKIKLAVRRGLISYGRPVGILAAQSFSQPLTQYVLDSHHRVALRQEGTDKMTRLSELLLARLTEKMKNPTMTLHVLPEYEEDKEKVLEIAHKIETMRVKQFIKPKVQYFFEEFGRPTHPDYLEEKKMIFEFEKNNPNVVVPSDLIKRVIRFELDRFKMVSKNMDLETIVFSIMTNHPNVFLVYNGENDDNMILRCYIRASYFKKNHIVKNIDLFKIKDKIINTIVRGVSGITATFIRTKMKSYVAKDGSVKKKKAYIIKTNGTNLSKIMDNPYMDVPKCQTDSILEIEHILGIEAARHKLTSEIMNIVSGMHYTHYTVYADEMCTTGTVTGIVRHGLIKREPQNILLHMADSFPIQVLQSATVDSLYSPIYGVSASLVVGRTPRYGATYNQITNNMEFLRSETKTLDDVMDEL